MTRILHILSWVSKLAGLVLALGAIPGVSPATGAIIFFAASLLKDTVNRIGDFLDDGQANDSFKP